MAPAPPEAALPVSERSDMVLTLSFGAGLVVLLLVLIAFRVASGAGPLGLLASLMLVSLGVSALSSAAFSVLRLRSHEHIPPAPLTARHARACLITAICHLAPIAVGAAGAASALSSGPADPVGAIVVYLAVPGLVFGVPASWLMRAWLRNRRNAPVTAGLEFEAMGFALAAQLVSIAFLGLLFLALSLPGSD